LSVRARAQVADIMSACLIANGLRDPPSAAQQPLQLQHSSSPSSPSPASSSAAVNSPLSDATARAVITHCLMRIGRPAERTVHGSVATGMPSSSSAADSSSSSSSTSSASSAKDAASIVVDERTEKRLKRIAQWHREMPDEEWRHWRAKGWQHWSRLVGLLSLHHLPSIIAHVTELLELFRKESGSLQRSVVFPVSCLWFIRICAPIHHLRDLDAVAHEPAFQVSDFPILGVVKGLFLNGWFACLCFYLFKLDDGILGFLVFNFGLLTLRETLSCLVFCFLFLFKCCSASIRWPLTLVAWYSTRRRRSRPRCALRCCAASSACCARAHTSTGTTWSLPLPPLPLLLPLPLPL
jgi:hypothetical protein